jgi:hypothetical protein
MLKPLRNTPEFDETSFRKQVQAWKRAGLQDGGRVVVEWSTGAGPHCYAFPAGNRASGVLLTDAVQGMAHDERWADFLEFEFVPRVVEALRQEATTPQVICVDLRPLRVQRARRREIEAAARAKTSSPAG